MPTGQEPPSSTASMRPSRSANTVRASVGLGRPLTFAEGAAMGRSTSRSRSRVTGWSGKRTAMVSSPAVTTSGTTALCRTIIVSGPGQNSFASSAKHGGTSCISSSAWRRSCTCTIMGLSAGRPFTSYTRRTAASSSAFAPSPYTVSVGKATSFPSRNSAAAAASPAWSGVRRRVSMAGI